MADLAKALSLRPPAEVEGTAVFLTQDLEVAPSALLHNLKHNKTLHRHNILLKVESQATPYVPHDDRLSLERIDDHFCKARLRYGYMDSIDVPSDLARTTTCWRRAAAPPSSSAATRSALPPIRRCRAG